MFCGVGEKVTTVLTLIVLLSIFIIFEDPVEMLENPKPKPQAKTVKVALNTQDKLVIMSLNPDNAASEKLSDDGYYKFDNNTVVHLWIDVPNSFPWRKCLYEYMDMMFTYGCSLTNTKQSLTVRTVHQQDTTRFRLLLGTRCVEPDTVPRQGEERLVVRVGSECSRSGVWRWSSDALLEWSGGGCLASLNGQDRTIIVPCDKNYDDQIVEFGVAVTRGNDTKLAPIDMEMWKQRMDRTREEEMKLAKLEIDKVLKEIEEYNKTGAFEKETGTRRAVVFYVDKGTGFLAYLTWWLYTWKNIGLDAA